MAADIDFDELDKAVNTLMGKVAEVPEKSDEDEPKQETLTINNTLKPGERPVYDKIGEVAKEIANEALTTDGERIVLENLDNLQKPVLPDLGKVASEGPVAVATAPIAVALPAPKPTPPAPRPAGGRFMDVVHPSSDMRTVSQTPPVSVSPVATAPVPNVAQPAEVTPVVTAPDAPLTPFLPDAKVEKRPLGAVPSPFETDASPATAPSEINSPVAPNAIGATEVSTEQANPAAESPELPAIENKVVEQKLEGEGLLQAIESGDTEKIKNASMGEPVTGAANGAIYDVNQFPQPLSHPGKQKSGIGVVIIILVIIVLAAALGGAAYFILGLGV